MQFRDTLTHKLSLRFWCGYLHQPKNITTILHHFISTLLNTNFDFYVSVANDVAKSALPGKLIQGSPYPDVRTSTNENGRYIMKLNDIEILLPVKFRWIPFSGFIGEVEMWKVNDDGQRMIVNWPFGSCALKLLVQTVSIMNFTHVSIFIESIEIEQHELSYVRLSPDNTQQITSNYGRQHTCLYRKRLNLLQKVRIDVNRK